MSDTFVINDIEKLAYSIRKNAGLTISTDANDNLDDFISIGQMKNLIYDYAVRTDDGDLILDEEGYEQIFDETSSWIINMGLAKLAGENKIECAWDDESNDMVFWQPNSVE